MRSVLRHGLVFLLLACCGLAQAAEGPREVVERTTGQLLGDLEANKARYREQPAQFHAALDRILGPVVDAEGISRSIMTIKYSRRASPEQMARFQENFKRSLMQFYGNALLEYENQQIRVLPGVRKEGERATVSMEVVGRQGAVYPVSYTMVQVGDQWLLRNVIINGINVGKLFRDQFDASMQRNGNDLDRTIDGWVQVVEQTRESVGDQVLGDDD